MPEVQRVECEWRPLLRPMRHFARSSGLFAVQSDRGAGREILQQLRHAGEVRLMRPFDDNVADDDRAAARRNDAGDAYRLDACFVSTVTSKLAKCMRASFACVIQL